MQLRSCLSRVAGMLFLALSISCAGGKGPGEAGESATKQAPLSTGERELLSMLPESGAVPGWSRSGEARFFNPGNLWEYIDGAAEGYLTYGFENVVTQEYANPSRASQAVVDIYRMKDARNAFGIYTSELNPESEFVRIGVEGYLGGTALNFWCGPYYVKITVFQENEELKQDMQRFADHVSAKLGEAGSEPAEVGYFPSADRIAHSIRYLPQDVLGQSYLTEGFEARYRRGTAESKLVIVSAPDEERAKDALARYRQFIAAGGGVQRELSAPGDGGFAGKDSYYGPMAAVRSGTRIVIALGGPSIDAALGQIKETIARMRQGG